ncbi:translocation/assembly module TamB domain-containing protein [Persephonella sp.]
MKKIIINALLATSILFLFLSLIFLTVIFLWESRSVIAENLGIQLKDNCRIKDSTLSCGYVKAVSKNFNLDLSNFSLGFNFTNFIRKNEPFIDLTLEEGKFYIKTKRKKNKGEKNFLSYTYFLIYFVKSDIKKLDLKINFSDGKRFSVNDFSFFNDFDTFSSYRPFFINFDGISARIEKFKGRIAPDELIFEEILTYLNGNPLKINGTLSYAGNFTFLGHFSGNNLTYKGYTLKNFDISFDINKFNKKLKGNVIYNIKTVFYRKITSEYIKGKVYFEGVKKLKGSSDLEISKLKFGKLVAEKIKSTGDFTYNFKNKKVELMASVDLYSSQIGIIKLEDINSKFRLKYLKGFSLEGTASSGNISAKYSYKNKMLLIEMADFTIPDILKTASLFDEKTKYIKGFGRGKIEIKEGKTTLDFSFKDLDVYGIRFYLGNVKSDIENRSFTGNYIINLKSINGFCFISGSFNKNYVEGDLTFDNIDLENFVYGKKFKFGGIIDGTGKYSGILPDLNIQVKGRSEKFFYSSIKIKDYFYLFNYSGKNKKILLSFNDPEKKLLGNIDISLKPFSMSMTVKGKNKDIAFTKNYLRKVLPTVFNYITPKMATGMLNVQIQKKKWKIGIDLIKGSAFLDFAGDKVDLSMKASLSKEKKQMKIHFYKENLSLKKEHIIGRIEGEIYLKNNKINFEVKGDGFNSLDKMRFLGKAMYDLGKKHIKGNFFLITKKGEFRNSVRTVFSGSLKKITGKLLEKGTHGDRQAIKTEINYSLSILKKKIKASLDAGNLSITLPQNFQLEFHNIKGNIDLPYKNPLISKGNLKISKFTASNNFIYFFDSSPVEIYLKDGVLEGNPVSFTGIIKGKISRFVYNIKENRLILFSDGVIDRNLLSIVIKYANTSGDLVYTLNYDGKLKDFERNIRLKISSKDLSLRTIYTLGIIQIKKFILDLEKGDLNLELSGKSPDVILGESVIKISGKGTLPKRFVSLEGFTRFFPIKYMNIYQGNLNSSVKLKTYRKEGKTETFISGRISISGRIRLEKDLNQLLSVRKKKIKKDYRNKELKNINLDLYAESYIPIYLYGKWGKAYAEFSLDLKGTAEKPLIDGDISIIYGEIYFLKNRYNIDFANIKIIQNEPYISARISTAIADTFIFIDLTGSLYNPRINFSSSPPKSKDEILSILLLRDTPSALENMPIFKTVGKILYALLPFKPSEERGLFNTGFEINILPQYSPTTGISASVYAKRSLTRRIFVALSKPLGQLEEEKIGGWYGIGLKIKERTSFQYKFFETGNQEFDIVFNFPFDF